MRNLRELNFNTFLAGLGVCAMMMQQVPALKPPWIQKVSFMLMVAAAVSRFEGARDWRLSRVDL